MLGETVSSISNVSYPGVRMQVFLLFRQIKEKNEGSSIILVETMPQVQRQVNSPIYTHTEAGIDMHLCVYIHTHI